MKLCRFYILQPFHQKIAQLCIIFQRIIHILAHVLQLILLHFFFLFLRRLALNKLLNNLTFQSVSQRDVSMLIGRTHRKTCSQKQHRWFCLQDSPHFINGLLIHLCSFLASYMPVIFILCSSLVF